MHKLLEKQVEEFFDSLGSGLASIRDSKELKVFLESISATYEHIDQDRYLLERSLDVSSKELMAINKKLEVEKAKDEAILASVGDGMAVTDTEGRVMMMNGQAETMLGWSSSDLEGKVLSDFVPVEDKDGQLLPRDKKQLSVAISSGQKVTTSSYFYFRKDQTKFPVAITAAPVLLGREVIGGVLIFRDITKEYDVDKAKSEFVSLASHQLRTPLSTMRWYLEVLLSGDAGTINDQQKEYLGTVYGSTRRTIDLVNALLNVSRLELGTFAIDPKPTNLAEISDIVLKELEPQIRGKMLKIIKNYDSNLPMIDVDGKLMQIIFQNLISNSVKYTPAEGQITVGITNKGTDALIEVSDNGYGIPQSQQPRIFTKLFRADNVQEKDPEGTGLGLYITKSVVERSGGKLWFESVENKGTTFYATIPLVGTPRKEGAKKLN